MSRISQDLLDTFADEVVTHAVTSDVEIPGGGGTLALITLDNGRGGSRPATFGPRGLVELADVLDELTRRAEAGEIQAVGVTGTPGAFAVGADLTGVAALRDGEVATELGRLGHEAFARLTDLGVPTFAFVGGAVMGGGLELALSCTARTVASDVRGIAFPEVYLGLVPGWGGAWLLPQLVGVQAALTMIVDNPLSSNRTLAAPAAAEMGLVDAVLDPDGFLDASLAWAGEVVRGEREIARAAVERGEQEWEAAVAKTRKGVTRRTGGCSPAATTALELVAAARTATREEGFAAEDQALARLAVTDELHAGLYAFDLLTRRARRAVGAPEGVEPRSVSSVGIVGAGLMAGQLALLVVRRLGVPVVLTDIDTQRVERGVSYVHGELDKAVAKGSLTIDKAARCKELVTGDTDKAAFSGADLVIEAVFEELSVKKQVWAEVEAVVSPQCVLATNTSSLSVTAMAADLAHPERVVGLHFFNPVAVMPLLEVVRAERTDDQTLATALAIGKGLGKTTILCSDSPSFVVNRLLGRFMSDMARIVDAGTPIDVADQGFVGIAPMPPFVLMGLVGPAIAMHNNETLASAFPERFYASPTVRRVVEAGKTAFYTTVDGRRVVDPEVEALVERPDQPAVLTPAEVRQRILDGLAQEARIMLDEGVVPEPMDLDLAMMTGAGFQVWNGGLTPLLDRSGAAERATGRRFLAPGVADASR